MTQIHMKVVIINFAVCGANCSSMFLSDECCLFLTNPSDEFIYVRAAELEALTYEYSNNFQKDGRLTIPHIRIHMQISATKIMSF